MIHQHELKAEEVRAYTSQTLKTHFEIEAHGYCCTTDMIYDVLLKASAECSSLEASCADLAQVADSNTVREYVNQALPIQALRSQEEQANQALTGCIPSRMLRQGQERADLIGAKVEVFSEPQRGTTLTLRASITEMES